MRFHTIHSMAFESEKHAVSVNCHSRVKSLHINNNQHGAAAAVLLSWQWGLTAGIKVWFNPSVHLCAIRRRHLDWAVTHLCITFWAQQLRHEFKFYYVQSFVKYVELLVASHWRLDSFARHFELKYWWSFITDAYLTWLYPLLPPAVQTHALSAI